VIEVRSWSRNPERHRRRWRVDFDVTYSEEHNGEFTKRYLTRLGAQISVWLRLHVYSYGGTAVLYDTGGRDAEG
jgi:hypothetical protein